MCEKLKILRSRVGCFNPRFNRMTVRTTSAAWRRAWWILIRHSGTAHAAAADRAVAGAATEAAEFEETAVARVMTAVAVGVVGEDGDEDVGDAVEGEMVLAVLDLGVLLHIADWGDSAASMRLSKAAATAVGISQGGGGEAGGKGHVDRRRNLKAQNKTFRLCLHSFGLSFWLLFPASVIIVFFSEV